MLSFALTTKKEEAGIGGCRQPSESLAPTARIAAAAVKGEVEHVPLAGSSAGPLHYKSKRKQRVRAQKRARVAQAEVRKLSDEEDTLSTLTKEAASKINKCHLPIRLAQLRNDNFCIVRERIDTKGWKNATKLAL